MEMDQIALEKIESLREERDYYKSLADLLQEALQERDIELRAARGQLSQLLMDSRVEVA